MDRLLDDAVFFAPFVPFFHPTAGRPSTPMETYLRLMFLKYRFDLGYERLCVAVNDSLSWRRFCRIGLELSDAGARRSSAGSHNLGGRRRPRSRLEARRDSKVPLPFSRRREPD